MIVKLSHTLEDEIYYSQRRLETEAAVYERLQAESVQFVPQFYGLYEWANGLVLIVSDEGTSLADLKLTFDQLPYSKRHVSQPFENNRKI